MVFSERLSNLLDERKVTWKEVYTELKIGKNQRKLWEDNDSVPDGETLIKLCHYFDVSADYLLGLSDNYMSKSPSKGLSILIRAFNNCTEEGQYRIIQACMNELDAAEARRVREEERVSG